MTVRKATLNDAPAVLRLWADCMDELDERVFTENPAMKPYFQTFLRMKEDALEIYIEYIQENIRSEDALVLIGKMDGAPVGYCIAQIKRTLPIYTVETMGFINKLYVKKEWRGRGISSQLNAETIKWLKEKGAKHVSIHVYADNKPARQIYENWGFREFQIELRREL
jgi:GNAT superfamily N-acetyltransferase